MSNKHKLTLKTQLTWSLDGDLDMMSFAANSIVINVTHSATTHQVRLLLLSMFDTKRCTFLALSMSLSHFAFGFVN